MPLSGVVQAAATPNNSGQVAAALISLKLSAQTTSLPGSQRRAFIDQAATNFNSLLSKLSSIFTKHALFS